MDRHAVLDRIREWGQAFTPQVIQDTHALFAPLVGRPEEAQVLRDQTYGDDPRHRLDLFKGDAVGGDRRPVLLFVHGGGFTMGDKGGADAPFHNNIGAWAAGAGIIGATMTYRLAPTHLWPSGGEDVTRAVHWLAANISEHGGDPDRIFVMGTSAGAVHVADAVTLGQAPVAGALMISGIYDLTRVAADEFRSVYYGAHDPAALAARSTLPGLLATDTPCFFSVAEHDPREFQEQAAWVVESWVGQHGRWPEMHWLAGHNHISTCSQIGSPHDDLGPLVASFIARTGRR